MPSPPQPEEAEEGEEEGEEEPQGPPAMDGPPSGEPVPSVDELSSKFYKVNFEYLNPDNEPDTLTLHVGDILIVLETRADGWWRGQSGDEVGLFPVAYCESITEEEVKQFIAASAAKAPKKPLSAAAQAERVQLEKEMAALKDEQQELAAQVTKLKEEVALMKDEAKKRRKQAREELLEAFDTLPPALYSIATLNHLQFDLVRSTSLIGRILDSVEEQKEILPDAIQSLNSFVQEAPKLIASEPKLKPEIDKVISKVLAMQKFLLDDMANINTDLTRKISEHMDTLFTQVEAVNQGVLSLDGIDPIVSPGSSKLHVSLSRSQRSNDPIEAIPEEDDAEPTSTPVSPREKKKRKKEKQQEEEVAEAEPEDKDKEKEKKKKKKRDGDSEDPVSPRSPRRRANAESEAQEAAPVEEEPVADEGEGTKEKKKKRKKDKAAPAEE